MALNPFLERQAFSILRQLKLALASRLVSYNPHSKTMLSKRSWGEGVFAQVKSVTRQQNNKIKFLQQNTTSQSNHKPQQIEESNLDSNPDGSARIDHKHSNR